MGVLGIGWTPSRKVGTFLETTFKLNLKSQILMVLTLGGLALLSCSNNSLSVEDTKWYCRIENSRRFCEVEFKLENSSHYSVAATVVIHGHERGVSRFGAIGKTVIPEKRLSIVIGPGEIREFKEGFDVAGQVIRFVVSAYGEKI